MSKVNKQENKTVKDTNKKKKIVRIIILVLSIAFCIFIFINILPFLFFVGSLFYYMFLDVPSKPKVKHGEFPFELVYEYKGEQRTINDTIICDYEGYSFSLDGGNSRDWDCEFKNNDEYGTYYIDKENLPDLYIVVPAYPDYYMGDREADVEYSKPYIYYADEETGTYYEEKEAVSVVGVKIIEWEPSEPLKNNIK